MRKWLFSTIIASLLLLSGCGLMGKYDEPDYQVMQSQGDIEIRQYQPVILAEVEVVGERDQAIRDGFRLLADYIFGNNSVQVASKMSHEKIKMTAPVIQQANQKIAMAIPVLQAEKDSSWLVQFVMPKQYTLQTLQNPRIRHACNMM